MLKKVLVPRIRHNFGKFRNYWTYFTTVWHISEVLDTFWKMSGTLQFRSASPSVSNQTDDLAEWLLVMKIDLRTRTRIVITFISCRPDLKSEILKLGT